MSIIKEEYTKTNPLEVKFKLLSDAAQMPRYSLEGDAGLDFFATKIISDNNLFIEYETDVVLEIPYGYVGLAFPRSSISKYTLALSNSVGVIDSGFRGSLKWRFRKLETSSISAKHYSVGDRIGQIVIIPFPYVKLVASDELSQTVRGEGATGSTGQ